MAPIAISIRMRRASIEIRRTRSSPVSCERVPWSTTTESFAAKLERRDCIIADLLASLPETAFATTGLANAFDRYFLFLFNNIRTTAKLHFSISPTSVLARCRAIIKLRSDWRTCHAASIRVRGCARNKNYMHVEGLRAHSSNATERICIYL